ncbi:MAG TPA: ABC transporter permease subunit [Xanthobacteraceae bacterium]|nr:ABC transporter permease subunit [Xanthobacteraceae bacterium]
MSAADIWRSPMLARLRLIVVVFIIWEIAGRWLVDPLFFAPASRVAEDLPTMFGTAGVPGAIAITLTELVAAFALAVAAGLSIGRAVGLNDFARRAFMPIILFLYGMPQVTILPIFVLLFGIGPACKIAFGFTHGVFPIIVTVVAGVQNIKPILRTSARAMGASGWQELRYVVFPHLVPSLFTGMRLGMTGVLIGVLLAELYVSTAGIGLFTTQFAQNFQPSLLLGLIATLATIAIVLNEAMRRLETHFSRWRD